MRSLLVGVFLDRYLKNDANAIAWLASNNIVVAGEGTAQWSHR